MASLGRSSRAKLDTCDPVLIDLLEEAIKVMDFTVVCGHRSHEEQARLFKEGLSEVDAGHSKHNPYPSQAVDVAPYYKVDKIRWDDIEAMCILYGIIQGIAHMKGVAIRWGGDWDGDMDRRDQTFDDVWHIELEGV
jgi:peptidoglycan L-alanyl-D-glutamate endopeptidase CwlK